jgi:hypothetical protein
MLKGALRASKKGSIAALLCFAACAMQHRLQIALLGVSSLDLGRSCYGAALGPECLERYRAA